jgi:hypothetical protein
LTTNIFNPEQTPLKIKISVKTDGNVLLGYSVSDASIPNTVYTYGKQDVNNKGVINILMPLSPIKGILRIWNDAHKNTKNENYGFKIVGVDKSELSSNNLALAVYNKDVLDFVEFAKGFAVRAAYLSTKTNGKDRSIYVSDNGKFELHYLDEIIDVDGNPLKSSMRINNQTGVIEAAKKYVKNYSVSEIMAILLHEFSHFYVNSNHKDEFEADKHALRIYVNLGFPKKEAVSGFYQVFYRSPSNLNIERMKKIYEFLNTFEK